MTMAAHILVPVGGPVSLAEASPGPFLYDGNLGFKTEYGHIAARDVGGGRVEFTMTNRPDAYVLATGEAFWGGASSPEARDGLIVQCLDTALPQEISGTAQTLRTKRIDELLQANNAYLHRARDAEAHVAELKAALTAHEDITESCGICRHPFVEGVLTLQDVNMGEVHAACCGPERDCYVDLETGEPLGPDDPIPTGRPWMPVEARPTHASAAKGEAVDSNHGSVYDRLLTFIHDRDDALRGEDQTDPGEVDETVLRIMEITAQPRPSQQAVTKSMLDAAWEVAPAGTSMDEVERIIRAALTSQQADHVPSEWTGQGAEADFFVAPDTEFWRASQQGRPTAEQVAALSNHLRESCGLTTTAGVLTEAVRLVNRAALTSKAAA